MHERIRSDESTAKRSRKTPHSFWLLTAILLLVFSTSGCGLPAAAPSWHHQAQHHMVAADHPDASRAGIAILRRGGNAVDAAVATSFALAVVRPESCGLGGGGFMVIHRPGAEPVALDYREQAPAAINVDLYRDESGAFVPERIRRGALAVGVPGTVRGLCYAHERYGSGKLTLFQVIEPALHLAKKPNIEIDEHLRLALYGLYADKVGAHAVPDPEQAFIRQIGTYPHINECYYRITNLQRTLHAIAVAGTDYFYEGPIADHIVATLKQFGGVMTHADLAKYEVREFTPLRFDAFGYQCLAMPPPSSGGAVVGEVFHLLAALNVQPGQSIDKHLLAESLKAAFADRAQFLGDRSPAVMRDTQHMLDPNRARELAQRISGDRASASSTWGSIATTDDGGTSHLSVIDRNGMAVACTESINLTFGSRIRIAGWGFVLNNTLDDFALDATTPNAFGLRQSERNLLRPGARPLSSMSPLIVLKDGNVRLVAGASGGPRIISSTIQTALNVLVEDQSVQDAVAAPRIHHQWLPEKLYIQPFQDVKLLNKLRRKGHTLQTRRDIGHVQAIERLPDGTLRAACDPLKGGRPAGD